MADGTEIGRLQRLFYDLRSQGASRLQEAWAVGLGAFIGCTPLFGLHLFLVLGVSRLFRLNALKMYLAAQVSNPFVLPILLLGELQVGAWLRRSELHGVTLEAMTQGGLWMLSADLLLGALVVGSAIGVVAGTATYLARSRSTLPPYLDQIFTRAANRYQGVSIVAWEFARGKLRGDPVYRSLLEGLLPAGGTLLDVGCGQGLMLAAIVEARDAAHAGRWPAEAPPPPGCDRLVGIETRHRVAAMANRALAGEAEIIAADARHQPLPSAQTVLLLDVLHLMPADGQEALLRQVVRAMEPGGVVLVREVDAGAGWGFQAVRFGNRLKALVIGRWREYFCFRRASEWRALFEQEDLEVDAWPMREGTPFANVLFRLTKRP